MELNVVTRHETVLPLVIESESVPDDLAEAYAMCRLIMRGASKNYSFASDVLPRALMPHVEALYAVMRVGDDRVDVSHAGFASPQAAIEDWTTAYYRAFETGDSHYAVLRAWLNTARTFSIPKEVLGEYFRAMIDDLSITRFETFRDLCYYMEGSAMTVGRAMTYILGTRNGYTIQDALPAADALSIGMQLSNFWRDIGEDWQIGRIYIPLEDLHAFGVSEDDIANRRITPQFIELLEFEMARTEEYYRLARPGVKMLANGRWAVQSALEIYRAIMYGIRRNRYNVFSKRAGTSSAHKLALAGKSWLVTLR